MKILKFRKSSKIISIVLIIFIVFGMLNKPKIVEATIAPGALVTGVKRCFAVSEGAMMFLNKDNVLWAGGDNNYYRLGVNPSLGTGHLRTPQRVDISMVSGKVIEVESGNHHTLVLDDKGNVYATGYNGYGQIGDGTTTNARILKKVNFPAGASKIVAISTGPYCSYSLDDKGDLYSWGNNSYGALGNGTTTDVRTPVKVLSGVKRMVGSKADTNTSQGVIMALKTDGSLWMAGYSGYNHFGISGLSSIQRNFINIPLSNFGGKQIKDIETSAYISKVLTVDGSLYTTGNQFCSTIVHSNASRWGQEILPAGMTCTKLFRTSTADIFQFSDNMIWGMGTSNADYGIYFGYNGWNYFTNPVTRQYFGRDGVIKRLDDNYNVRASTDISIYGSNGNAPIIDLSDGWDESFIVDADGNLRTSGNNGLRDTSTKYYDPINSYDSYVYKRLVTVERTILDPIVTVNASSNDPTTGFPMNPTAISMGPKQQDVAAPVTEVYQIWNADADGNPTTKYTGVGASGSNSVTMGPATLNVAPLNFAEGIYVIEVYRTATAPYSDINGGGNLLESNHSYTPFKILKQYTLTYNGNTNTGGTVPAQPTIYSSTTSIPVAANTGNLVKTGYNLTSWNTAANGSGTAYTVDGNGTISGLNEDTTLYAQWTAKSDIVVTFDSNGGNAITQNTKTVTFARPYDTLPIPTKTGYKFLEWTDAQTGGNSIIDTTPVSKATNHTLYAQWTAATNIIVTFDSNGGATPSPSSKGITFASQYGTLPEPIRVGYRFIGWTDTKSGGNEVNASTIVSIATDHILYAQWTAVTDINVTFNPNGGNSVSPASKTVTYANPYGQDGTLPTPTRVGHTFVKWTDSPTGGNTITDTTLVSTATDHSLYAQWTQKTNINVTLDSNGGNQPNPSSIKVTYGNSYGTLPIPTRSGYKFVGWTDAKTEGNSVNATTTVTNEADHTLYANWTTSANIVVSFDANEGDEITDIKNVAYLNAYGTLPTPTRSGYKFLAWTDAQTGGNAITETSLVEISTNHTLYAQWSMQQAATIKVTFDPNGGNPVSPSEKMVAFANPYTALPTPTKSGYTFVGWTDAQTGGNPVNDKSAVAINADHTLYAQWTTSSNNITVTFDSNGGNAVVPESINVTFANAYGILPTPTRSGYTFVGWTDAQTGGNPITSDTPVAKNVDHTIYAQWRTQGGNITVTFDSNGGNAVTPTSMPVTFANPYGLMPTPTRSGYNFVGWTDAPSGGNPIIQNTLVGINANHTIYAQWTPTGGNITVAFDSNGGNVVYPENKPVTLSNPYGILPTPVRQGYNFVGWTDSQTGGNPITPNTLVGINANHTIYAQWTTSGGNIIVTFDPNGGSSLVINTSNVTFANPYGILPTPVRQGYTFVGWTNAPLGGSPITPTTLVGINANHTIYAQWASQGGDITVTFDPNGGDPVNPSTTKVTFTNSYGTLPTPTRSGYIFVGWTDSKFGGNPITIVPITLVAINADHTLYAQWKPQGGNITVTFDPNGGSPVSPSTTKVTFANPYGILPAPVRQGYTFVGWTDAQIGGRPIVTANTLVGINGDHTLYAQWTPQGGNITVTFDPNGGNALSINTTKVTFANIYGLTPTPIRAGYNFVGWTDAQTGGNPILPNTLVAINGDHTLYAQWSARGGNIKVIFDPNGGEALLQNEMMVTYGSYYGTLPTAVRSGYTFKGWSDTQSGSNMITSYSMVNKTTDHTLYAQWEQGANNTTSNTTGNTTSASGNTTSASGNTTSASSNTTSASSNTTSASSNTTSASSNTTSNTTGNTTSASGNTTSSSSNTTSASSNTTSASGNTTSSSGNTTSASGNTTSASSNTTSASGNTTSSSSNTTSASGNTTSASGNTTSASGNTTSASGNTTSASGNTTSASGNTTSASSNTTSASGNTTSASGNTTSSSSNTTSSSSNTTSASGNTTSASSNTTSASSNTTSTSGNTTSTSGNTTSASGNTTSASSNTTSASSNTTSSSSNTTSSSSNTTSASGNTTSASGNTTSASGNTTSASGNTTSASSNTTSASGNTTSASSNTTSASGNTTSASSNTTSASGNTTSSSSNTTRNPNIPKEPIITPILSTDPAITGSGEPGDKIIVTFPGGSTKETTIGTDGKWSVPVAPRVLTPGDTVKVVEDDNKGNKSPEATSTVLDPANTIVDLNNDVVIYGTGFTINVSEVAGLNNQTVKTKASAKAWKISDGTDLTSILAVDKSAVKATSGAYPTTLSVNGVTKTITVNVVDNTTVIIGDIAISAIDFTIRVQDEASTTNAVILTKSKAKAWNTVTGTDLTNKIVVDSSKLMPAVGVYPVSMKVDMLSAIQGTDTQGNPAAIINITIVDVVPPVVNPIVPGDTSITGTGEPGDIINVTLPDGTNIPFTIGSDGTWSVPLPDGKTLNPGNEVSVTETDPNTGKTSEPTVVKVRDYPTAPIINPISPNDTSITGTGEPANKVVVIFSDGRSGEVIIGTDGTWSIPLPQGETLNSGDTVKVYEEDRNGNKSPETIVTVLSNNTTSNATSSTSSNTSSNTTKNTTSSTSSNTSSNTTKNTTSSTSSNTSSNTTKNTTSSTSSNTSSNTTKNTTSNTSSNTTSNISSNTTNNTSSNDIDGDGIPNDIDPDIDGDGIPNNLDPDMDGDGIPNDKDPDIDGDGIPNGEDPTPNGVNIDTDKDGKPNDEDDDIDGDGIPNDKDPDVDGDGIPNGQDPDVDGDGIPNGLDPDIDGDGIPNNLDPDMDGDGIPNDKDPDIDGDGIPNGEDPTPNGINGNINNNTTSNTTSNNATNITSNTTSNNATNTTSNTTSNNTNAVRPPTIKPIIPTDINVTGTGNSGDKVVLTFSSGKVIETTVGTDGKWSIPIPEGENLKPGDIIKAYEQDKNGNKSPEITSKVYDPNKDSDGDGVPDYIEEKDGTNSNDPNSFKDTDKDGVPDYIEEKDGTNPNDPNSFKDTDKDGIPDYIEKREGTDPSNPNKYKDTDKDGVPDYIEKQEGTDPNDKDSFKDTNNNGIPDYIEKPTINAILPGDPFISGKGVPGDKIIVELPDGNSIETKVDNSGNWKIALSQGVVLKPGDKIKVNQQDLSGKINGPVYATVDDMPAMSSSNVNPIYPGDAKITGTGRQGDKVVVIFPDGNKAETTVGADGKWSLDVTQGILLNPGDQLSIYSEDKNGNKSNEVKVIVNNYPAKPVVNEILPRDTSITGKGTPGDTIVVVLPNGLKQETIVDGSGNWSVNVPSDVLKPGDKVNIIERDPNGKTRAGIDVTISNNPTMSPSNIDPINTGDKQITGTGRPGDKIIIELPDGTKLETIVGANGRWSAQIPQGMTLKPGQSVRVYAVDRNGNESNRVSIMTSGSPPLPTTGEYDDYLTKNITILLDNSLVILGLLLIAEHSSKKK